MMESLSPILIVMGVSGCGKTVVGKALAEQLGCPFLEGDTFHPATNIAKMSSGTPLNDKDRAAWLVALRTTMEKQTGSAVLSCSALKRRHRAYLSEFPRPVVYLHLTGERSLLEERISSRRGHFFDPNLLGSQIEALEPPVEDEEAIALQIDDSVENIVAETLVRLKAYGVYPLS